MPTRCVRWLFTAGMLVLCATATVPAQQQGPVLESYTLDSLNAPTGVYYRLYDRSLGGGTAHMSLKLRREGEASVLLMRVWREVPPGSIAFALLVDRIHVLGTSGDTIVYDRELVDPFPGGILFGDSKSGDYRHRFDGIPPTVDRIVVTLDGNYE